jgi:hypothetical protein
MNFDRTVTRNGQQGSRMGTRIEESRERDDGVDLGDFDYSTPPSSELRYSYTQLHQHTNISSRKLPFSANIALSILKTLPQHPTNTTELIIEIIIDEQK